MHVAKKLLFACILVGITFGAVPLTYAQSRSGWIGRMDTNLYIGGNVGQAQYRTSCDNVPVSCDDNDLGWRAFAGWQFHRNFAIEGGYFDLGKAEARGFVGAVEANAGAKVHGWELLAVGLLPLNPQFSLFAKAGVARTRVNVSGSAALGSTTLSTSSSDTSTDFTFGVGAQYLFTPHLGARLEWQRYNDVGGGNTGKDDIDLFSGGLMYRF